LDSEDFSKDLTNKLAFKEGPITYFNVTDSKGKAPEGI